MSDLRDQITKWRATADLDARAGEPVGKALREAADEVERLRAQLAELTAAKDAEIAKLHGDVGRAKDALGIVKAKVPQVSQHRLRERLREAEAERDRLKATNAAAKIRAALDQPSDQDGTT